MSQPAANLAVPGFAPTAASIPPKDVNYRRPMAKNQPVWHTPLDPVNFLLRAALIYPKKVALAHLDVPYPVSYTYDVWAQRIQNLAYALIESGIKPGDRVAVIAPNCPMMADAHHAILAARGIITPLNYRLTKGEIQYILEHSGAKLILCDHEFTHLLPENHAPVIISQDTGRVGDPYEDFLARGRRFSQERGWSGLPIEPDENAGSCLCYTSGTTGRPKGVLTTYRGSYLAAVANAYETKMDLYSIYLWTLPMFHACGWTYPWAITFSFASQVTLRTVNYDLIWKNFKNSRISHYCAAPTVQIGIVNARHASYVEQPLRAIIAGAAPTAHLIGSLEKIGISVSHVYGLTETYGPFTISYDRPEYKTLTVDERSVFFARQGHSFATADEIRVIQHDNDSKDLVDIPKDGVVLGEITARGNVVMKEYFRDPKATAEAFKGGYFHSGDLAIWHPDGSIAVQDRSKDLIISGGENASSLAIEQVLSKFPPVLEATVVARPHEKWGERPMAFVILHSHEEGKWKGKDKEFEIELKKFARQSLPGFAVPEWVAIVKELPKTSTGKIQKNILRQRLAKL
ncbi:AMP-dependent synthetase and ligase [Dacryopinax primogenitus]|uniref:AMP-dependent synthetase and ligase n=1 Tax=Dacryopinax primogenitus (strain DJM 731) TaxID=1858805 RepID=M5G7Q7_DACPD|nr:AMP-dependent synthetase and ligase [Dacryopinax primogenitus]EJU01917.1 AMP-dependent synthetase and ligase [Dacryopinax primogenitus]